MKGETAIEKEPLPHAGAGEEASDVSGNQDESVKKVGLPTDTAHDRRMLEAIGAGTLDDEC